MAAERVPIERSRRSSRSLVLLPLCWGGGHRLTKEMNFTISHPEPKNLSLIGFIGLGMFGVIDQLSQGELGQPHSQVSPSGRH